MTEQLPLLKKEDLVWFPEDLFLCEDGAPMHFIFSMNTPEAKYAEVLKLMKHCGASVSKSLKDVTSHSVLIVDHNHVLDFMGPAFNYTYLMECLKELKIVDMTDHRQSITSLIARGVDLLDVVYYKTKSWSSVLTSAERRWIINESSAKTVKDKEQQMTLQDESTGPLEIPRLHPQNENIKNKCSMSLDKRAPRDKQKSPSDDDLQRTVKGKSTKSSKAQKRSINSEWLSKKRVNKNTVEDSESIQQNRENVPQQANENSVESVSETSGTRRRSTRAKKHVVEPDSTRDDFPQQGVKIGTKSLKDSKHSRASYTEEERVNILKYIVKLKQYHNIKGRRLWETMEMRKVCPIRTWQSMKEHFIKKIIMDLDRYDFLTDYDKRKLKECYYT